MSKTCLEQAIRLHSGPLLFLVGVCMALAWLFFRVDPGASWTFVLASGVATVVFSLVASRGGCGR